MVAAQQWSMLMQVHENKAIFIKFQEWQLSFATLFFLPLVFLYALTSEIWTSRRGLVRILDTFTHPIVHSDRWWSENLFQWMPEAVGGTWDSVYTRSSSPVSHSICPEALLLQLMGVQQSSGGPIGLQLEVFLQSISKGVQGAVISDLKAGHCLKWCQNNTVWECLEFCYGHWREK